MATAKITRKVELFERIPTKRIDKEKIVNYFDEEIRTLEQERASWLQRQAKYLRRWDDFLTKDRRGAWAGSSDLHLPVTMQHVKAIHARMVNSIFAVRPWFSILPLEEMDIDRVRRIEKIMHWALTNYVNNWKGIYTAIDDWVWDLVTVGWGVLKVRWDVIMRKAIQVVEETEGDRFVRQNLTGAEESEQEGDELAAELRAEVDDIFGTQYSLREIERFIKVFEGPIIETIAPEDILFPAGLSDASDLNEPSMVVHQLWLSAHDLRLRRDRGLYDKKAVKVLLDKYDTNDDRHYYDNEKGNIRYLRNYHQGINPSFRSKQEKKFLIDEVYTRYDIDDDGYDEEVVLWLHRGSGTLLRWTYLDRITATGQRPLFKVDLLRRPRRAYSMGIPELLNTINEEVDIIHNQRVDFGSISNMPMFFYRYASGFKPEELNVRPGMGVPLDDVNDVKFANFPNSTVWGFQEEASLLAYAERQTGVTDLNTGRQQQGIRTASQTAMLLNESNIQMDIFIKRLQSSYSRMLKELLALLQDRLPPNLQYRVIGSDGNPVRDEEGNPLVERLQSRVEIAGRVDFELNANSANMNREVEKQNAILIGQTLLNPINLQLGIVNANNVYAIQKNILEKYGVLNVDQLLTEPKNIAETPLTLDEEINAIVQGILPKLSLADQHDIKAAMLQQFAQSELFQRGVAEGTVNENAASLLAMTIQKHMMMAEAIRAQAAAANTTGLQISPTLGARMAGQVEQKTGQPVAQEPRVTPEGVKRSLAGGHESEQ